MSTGYTLAPESLGPTITIGEILVEIMAVSVGEGFPTGLTLMGPYPSGAPAIFIDQCARMGGSAAMIGAVGNDDFGALNIARLQEDGVDVSAINIDPRLPTGSAFVRYRPDGDRHFVFNISASAAANIGWNERIAGVVKRAGHLHIMGTVLTVDGCWQIIEKALADIKQRGGTLSLDPNIRKELHANQHVAGRFRKLLACTDLLLPSGDELLLAAEADRPAEALNKLFALGIKEIVLKQGERGATCYRYDGELLRSPAFDVQEVDPTGAGDCFGGAYVACRRAGMSVADALKWANAAGARNVTVRGPMEGAGNRRELEAFILHTGRKA